MSRYNFGVEGRDGSKEQLHPYLVFGVGGRSRSGCRIATSSEGAGAR